MTVVSSNKQRKALMFLDKNIFSSNAFHFEPELLNKLAPERYSTMTRWGGASSLDLSLHKMVSQIQRSSLYKIFNPTILQRVQDNEIRLGGDEDKFTLNELFATMTTITWKELENNANVNSFRRNLQKEHLKILVYIMLNKNNDFL